MMDIRAARASDIDAVMDVIHDAQRFMASQGLDQWQDGYPQRELLESDIRKGDCRVIEYENAVHGVFVPISGDEPCYADIEGGAWLTDGPYLTVHRGAFDKRLRGCGASDAMFDFCEALARERGAKSVRIDTHPDNGPMNAVAKRRGFSYCGVVWYPGRLRRVAYEKKV